MIHLPSLIQAAERVREVRIRWRALVDANVVHGDPLRQEAWGILKAAEKALHEVVHGVDG